MICSGEMATRELVTENRQHRWYPVFLVSRDWFPICVQTHWYAEKNLSTVGVAQFSIKFLNDDECLEWFDETLTSWDQTLAQHPWPSAVGASISLETAPVVEHAMPVRVVTCAAPDHEIKCAPPALVKECSEQAFMWAVGQQPVSVDIETP